MTVSPAPSATTQRARALVAGRKDAATGLGRSAGELVNEPAVLVASLRSGLETLADPEYLAGQQMIAPGLGPQLGVRQPLLGAVSHGLRAATRQDPPAALLDLAAALFREPVAELHWLAIDVLDRTIAREPEQTWQLVRAEARRAAEWITVDRLAHVVGRGILAEGYRWAELEQLVYSPSRWERRLAGSTVATIPFVDRTAGRSRDVARHGIQIVGQLIGDREPDVQKALAWAIRSLTLVDQPAVIAFLRGEAQTARETGDGHRAWVIRDSVEKLPVDVAAGLKDTVAGIRKRPGSPSTSRAAATALDFLASGVGIPPAERAIIDRG